jgi:hypothetical protein
MATAAGAEPPLVCPSELSRHAFRCCRRPPDERRPWRSATPPGPLSGDTLVVPSAGRVRPAPDVASRASVTTPASLAYRHDGELPVLGGDESRASAH